MEYSLDSRQEELSSEFFTEARLSGIERRVRLAVEELNNRIQKIHIKILKTGRHYQDSSRFAKEYKAARRPGEIFLEDKGQNSKSLNPRMCFLGTQEQLWAINSDYLKWMEGVGCKQELVTYSFVLGSWISKYMDQEEVMKFCQEKNYNVICEVSQLSQNLSGRMTHNLLVNIQAMNDQQCRAAHDVLLKEIERFKEIEKTKQKREDALNRIQRIGPRIRDWHEHKSIRYQRIVDHQLIRNLPDLEEDIYQEYDIHLADYCEQSLNVIFAKQLEENQSGHNYKEATLKGLNRCKQEFEKLEKNMRRVHQQLEEQERQKRKKEEHQRKLKRKAKEVRKKNRKEAKMQKALYNQNISDFRLKRKGNSEMKVVSRRGTKDMDELDERVRFCASEERPFFLQSMRNNENQECNSLYFEWLCIQKRKENL